jgi:RimJ/RimL family protein N-acetyltransferase
MASDDLDVPPSGLARGPVLLRRFMDSDRPALTKAIHDPLIARYMLIHALPTEADRLAWVDRLVGPWPPSTAQLAITETGRSELDGGISLHLVRARNSAESGYWISPDRRGHRLASTALSIVADWVFDVLGVGRLSLLIDLDNPASSAVAARCGFTREGVLRSYQPIRDHRPDLESWSLIPTDRRPWASSNARAD